MKQTISSVIVKRHFIRPIAAVATVLIGHLCLSAALAETAVIDATELAAHAGEQDCWIAVQGEVYDVTGYVPQHPTSPIVITIWCGKDATESFTTKNHTGQHSEAALQLLRQYRVGRLAQE
jgi:cytochrome b involved in lipid metabolism